MEKGRIQLCTMEHIGRYAQIYAAAFSGEPWNDSWTVEDDKSKKVYDRKRFKRMEQKLSDKLE